MDWKTALDMESTRAEQARRENNEGMARVCARRAAGHAAGEFLRRLGLADASPSAYDRLQLICALPDIPPVVVDAAQHLLVRLTPEHTLPVEADLINEAIVLRKQLLKE